MAITYYFFDSQPIYQADWTATIGKALLDGVVCGYLNDLFCFGDASGMQVKVRSGMCHIKGNYMISDAETVLVIGAAPGTAGQSRYDLVVCEVNWSTKAMTLKIVAGTASASPSVPALTRSATIWQIPLAVVTVAYGNTNVAASAVTDLRGWALGTFAVPVVIGTGMSVITTGVTPSGFVVPVRAKVVAVHLTADATGSISLDVWKDEMSAYPPTVADTICAASNKAALSSARYGYKSVWNEATYTNGNGLNWPGHVFAPNEFTVSKPSVLVNVESIATLKQVCFSMTFARMIAPQS